MPLPPQVRALIPPLLLVLPCRSTDWPASSPAAAAARINAQLQARKGIQHVDVPPIKSATPPAGSGTPNAGDTINGEMYVADGDYIKDIEVNDLRNRYLLTKGSTQKMVNMPWWCETH